MPFIEAPEVLFVRSFMQQCSMQVAIRLIGDLRVSDKNETHINMVNASLLINADDYDSTLSFLQTHFPQVGDFSRLK